MSEALTKQLAEKLRAAAAALDAIPTQGAMFHSGNAMRDSAKWREAWKRGTQSLEEVADVFRSAAPTQCLLCEQFVVRDETAGVSVNIHWHPAGVAFGGGSWQVRVCVPCMKALVPKLASQDGR